MEGRRVGGSEGWRVKGSDKGRAKFPDLALSPDLCPPLSKGRGMLSRPLFPTFVPRPLFPDLCSLTFVPRPWSQGSGEALPTFVPRPLSSDFCVPRPWSQLFYAGPACWKIGGWAVHHHSNTTFLCESSLLENGWSGCFSTQTAIRR